MNSVRKSLIRMMILVAVSLSILPFLTEMSNATDVEKTILPETTKYLSSGKSIEFSFTTFDDMAFMLPIKIKMYDTIKSGGVSDSIKR